MKTIRVDEYNKFLREHGIDLLTSEADGTGLRGLYDLNDQGVEILSEFLGGVEFTSPNWNSRAIKSTLLSWEIARPLCIYILLRDGCNAVAWVHGNTESWYANYLRGYTGEQEEIVAAFDELRSFEGIEINSWWRTGTARDGMRNQHVFSGRVE